MNKNILKISIALFFTLLTASCGFFNSFTEEAQSSISSMSFSKSTLSTQVGSLEYIELSVKPSSQQKNIRPSWSYDSSVIECDTSSVWGVTVKGLKEGQTTLRVSFNGIDASCLVTVKGYSEMAEYTTEPYIYSNYSIIQTSPGVSERVFVSLFQGDAGDIDGYTWSIDNPTVASIQPTGQYCLLTAKETGYARVKVTHTKAAYPYYIGLYVFDDATKVSYITTSNNIVTLNQEDGDTDLYVSLVNAKDQSQDSSFRWEVIDESGSSSCVSLNANGNHAVISPKTSGSCTLRITHPDAVYPLDILVRVITVVKNVYINPDSTVVSLQGEATHTVTSKLEGLQDGSYDIDGYTYALDDPSVCEIVNAVGNKVIVKGKANGSCKLFISHEKAAYSREVLLIVTGQLTDAVNAKCYITTSQNYIRTKKGDDTKEIFISLKGGEDGDENGFTWSVKSQADDGSYDDVIKLETPKGSTVYAKTVSQTYSASIAYLEPEKEGTAVITITHPKAVYPTEILVKVLSEDAVLEEPLYFSGDGLVKILNGKSFEYHVNLLGSNKKTQDESSIKWECDNPDIRVSPSSNNAVIEAPKSGSGSTQSVLTISHKKADTDKTVLILTADDEKTLNSMKALYSDKTNYNLSVGETVSLYTYVTGCGETSSTPDFSTVMWYVKDPSVLSLSKSESNPLTCTVKALKSGSTKVTMEYEGLSLTYTVLVYPEGAVSITPEIYFTTSQNVVVLEKSGKSVSVNVTPVNMEVSSYSEIKWTVENSDIAEVIPNGNRATVTAKKEGETVVKVTHPESENSLKIYIRVGSEYEIPSTDPVVYISSEDVITLLKDDLPYALKASLVNNTGSDYTGFSFEIDNTDVAAITAQSTSGTAYIKPVGSGQAEVTIRHTKTDIEKKVLIVVGNSLEELKSYTYLTTSQNVVALGEGTTKTVSVSVKNAATTVIDGFTWTSSNPNIVDVTSSGSSAVLKGNSIGSAFVTVTNISCKYYLTLIVQVIDPIKMGGSSYIQLSSSVLTLTVNQNYTSVTADLIGGSAEDYSDFLWTVNDPSVCAVYGQNEVGKIKALSSGQTYITVTHPKANYASQLLVVCEKERESECYITVPTSIISMKPNATTQSVTASLVNGTQTDKYNFSWSLDVYDVIDLQYSGNVCSITPKQTGCATITISHPKAQYSQQIIVNVQEYSNFSFPQTSLSMTQGTVSFLNMEVPTTSVTTHVEYSVDNPSICSVSGTKAVCQVTGIKAGTTTLRAKLVASSTGVTQAQSELLVYVKESSSSQVYITASSTIFTVNKGKSQSLSASLTGNGISTGDQYNLKWTTSDSDVISVTGIQSDGTVKGQSIYITALKPGEALITCSHEKASSDLQFYVVVPGVKEKYVSLNKTYITLTKGSSGTQLKATIDNLESSSEYYDLEWNAEKVNGAEIVRIMGSGQSVTVYPLSVGETTVTCQLPGTKTVSKCTVVVENGKSLTFETTSKKVQPFHTKRIKYIVSPPDAYLTWTCAQDDDYFTIHDLGCDKDGIGYVEIEGLKEGSGTLACVTDGSAKASCTVKVVWDYAFDITQSSISGSPGKTYEVEYSLNPSDAIISVNPPSIASINIEQKMGDTEGDGVSRYTGKGIIKITPTKEGTDSFTITATNKDTGEKIGTKTVNLKFQYQTVNVKASLITREGSFSRYDRESNILYMGDGETVTLGFDLEENIDWTLSSSSLDKRVPTSVNTKLSNGVNNQIVIKNTSDTIYYEYLIPTWYDPMAVDTVTSTTSASSSSTTTVTYVNSNRVLNPKTDFHWAVDDVGFLDYYADWYLSPTRYWKKENPAKANTRMSITEYESTAWYWRPEHGAIYHWDGTVAAGPWTATQTGNQPATKVSSDSTKVISTVNTDILTVVITHSGITQRFQINVITETRNCPFDYQ